MIPVSDDFKKFIYSAGRELLAKVEADLADGTHLTLSSYDLLEGGFEIEDAVSESGRFQVGAAIINQFTLVLNNFEDKAKGNSLAGRDFTGAVLRPYVGLVVKKDWHGDTVEWVPKGVFTAEKPTAAGSRITVTALDNMAKLDTAYSKSTLAYPATLGQIAADVCAVCGVMLATTAFPNSTYSVTKRPTEESITCREVLAYVAQLAGCFARCNSNGAAEIRWYTEGDTLYDVGIGASSASIADADTVVAGVQIQGSDNTVYSSGADGFVVRIQDNPLAQDGLQAIADALGVKFNGYTFRAYTASSPSNPAVEAGDVVNMTDVKGTVHKTIVSRLVYSIGDAEEYDADAETAAENQSERFTAAQKAQEAADTAQQTADEAKQEVELVNVQIGNLTVRVSATESGLSSKVDRDDVGSEIQQHPEDILLAFNSSDGSKSIKITGDGFDFYYGSTYIGHLGVANNSLDFYLASGKSMQWHGSKGNYAMSWHPYDDGSEGGFHAGNLYPDYVNMKGGSIMGAGQIQADRYSVGDTSGDSYSTALRGSDGSVVHVRWVNGIMVEHTVSTS